MVLSMERWNGKVAIVTGASAGIGAAVVEALVSAGVKVAGLARRKEKIEQLAKTLSSKSGKLYAVKADISNEEDILAAFKWVAGNLGPVHILVNNAGIIRNTSLVDGDTKLWKEVLDTNVLGLCIATREAVKNMRANNVDGHIIHINSVVGHRVTFFPTVNVYCASKFAVTALTETLRNELSSIKSNIKITSISPGYVKTDFIQESTVEFTPELIKELNDDPWLKAEDIADAAIYALSTPPHVQVHELMVKPLGEKF